MLLTLQSAIGREDLVLKPAKFEAICSQVQKEWDCTAVTYKGQPLDKPSWGPFQHITNHTMGLLPGAS
jgi:hypothetical protein